MIGRIGGEGIEFIVITYFSQIPYVYSKKLVYKPNPIIVPTSKNIGIETTKEQNCLYKVKKIVKTAEFSEKRYKMCNILA